MKIGKIAIIGILLLSIINSAGAVWIYTDVDIIVGDITLNTVTDQNFSYVEIGMDYTNLSWDGSTYYNISFLSNIQSTAADVQYNGTYNTNLTIDVYNFTYSEPTTTVSMKIITNNSVIDATTGSLSFTEVNSTHRRYYYVYNPSDTLVDPDDMGLFDVNISVLMENNTLTYSGYKLFSDVFTVSTSEEPKIEIDKPPVNGTTEDSLVELHGFCSMGTDSTNFSADVYADVYSPSGWTVNYVCMQFYTNNSELDQNIIATSYTQVNDTYRQYSCEYNPTNTLSQADMGWFDVNVTVSAENTTHEYTNYTFFNNVFEVYKLHPVSNVSSEYNATYDSVNFSWGAFGEQVYYFNSSGAEQWNNYPANLIDGDMDTYARAAGSTDTHNFNNNTCDGTNIGTIYSVSLRFYAYIFGANTIDLTPVFSSGDGNTSTLSFTGHSSWSTWQDITTDPNAPGSWYWSNISNLDAKLGNTGWNTYASIVQLRVLYYPELVNSSTDRYIVVRSNTTAPICPTDGYIVHNSTAAIYNTARDFTETYFTVYAYNETTQSYSEGTPLPWGGLGMNCFNESSPDQSIDFDIEITNSDASEVYTNSSLSNPFYISLEDIPYGTNTIFVVSNSSYKQRIYYYTLNLNHFYNYSFYLPPKIIPGGGDENETILCLISVIDELGQPVPNATVNIKRYINTTDSYENVSIRITDGNGEFVEWLIPTTLYMFEITRSGYVQMGSKFWTPTTSQYTKTFMLEFEEVEYPPGESEPEEIDFSGYISGNSLYINYSDNMNETIDTQIYIYETNHSTANTVLYDTDSKTGDNSFQIDFSINTSNTYTVILHYNHTTFGYQSRTLIFEGEYETVTTQSRGDTLFELNYGATPFGWSNIFMWIILIAGCLTLDQRGSGITLVLVGFIFLFLNYWIGFNTVLSVVAGGVIPVLFIALGFMVAWDDAKRMGVTG